jgi:molecular chaperone DnaK
MARLRRAAETAKIGLSSALEIEVREEFITTIGSKPVHLACTVTRRDFEAAIAKMLDSTIELARRAVDDAQLRPDERIGRICLVGGSTRIPMIRSLLAEAFDADIHEEIDVDLAVGLGAAIQCGMLTGQACGRVLVDVAAHTLGLRVFGREDQLNFGRAPILRRNTALPAERTEELYTMFDDQEYVRVEVFQGESRRCSQNVSVGGFDFDLEPAPENTPVRFRIAYDLDGIVRVTASQGGADREQTVELKLPDASGDVPLGKLASANSVANSVESEAPQSAVLRRALRLLDTVRGQTLARLTKLIASWSAATPDQRPDIEDELLDLFLQIEAEEP